MRIVITSPSLDAHENVSGVSAVANFIIRNNREQEYMHFRLGKRDSDRRNPGWLFRITGAYFKWFILLLKNRDLLIHFNLALGKLYLLRDVPLICLARIMKRRIIIHLHGGRFLSADNWPRWVVLALKCIFRGTIPLLVLSESEKNVILKKFKNCNVWVLPNCVETAEAREFHRDFPPNRELNLLFMGRINEEKGMNIIIKALEQLSQKGIGFRFILAGKGRREEEYRKRLAVIPGDRFEFKGVVTGTEKANLFMQCDLFLLPSRFEGLPITLLEAMSFGMVPLVTAVGSVAEVIQSGNNGLILPCGTAKELVEAIEKLSADRELLKQLSTHARNYIFSHFDVDRYISTLNKIYSHA